MNLLFQAYLKRHDVASFSPSAYASSNANLPFGTEAQSVKSGGNGKLTAAAKKEIKSYRDFKKREKKLAGEEVKEKGKYTLLPARMKQEIRRKREIREEDISPTVS